MRIAIISDVHNNEVNLKKVLNYCAENKIEKIICCGDLASLETLEFLNDNFRSRTSEIYFTFGNMDDEQLTEINGHSVSELKRTPSVHDPWKYRNTLIFKDSGEIKIEDKKIAFVHYPREAKELAETGKYNFVFYGHTHKPWTEVVGNCTMLNPGNVAGEIYPPTFAVWNTEDDKFELIRIHNLK